MDQVSDWKKRLVEIDERIRVLLEKESEEDDNKDEEVSDVCSRQVRGSVVD